MKVRHRLILILSPLFLSALMFAPRICRGQADKPAAAPPDISFTIRFKDGRTKFYQGQLITIEMLFASKTPNVYQLYGGTYDRGGRFEVDRFYVEPVTGIVDPTAEYFHMAGLGFNGGGLSPGPITLQEKPYIIARDMNELVRFDQPGHYRLYVTNSRVGVPVLSGRTRTVKAFLATSNTIEFDVLRPDLAWQKTKIQEAVEAIDKSEQNAREACRTLRFMNSAEAEVEMIRLYSVGCEGEFRLGLVGSPRRTALIEMMETQIAAPDYPVTSDFIGTLSSLAFMKENPDQLPPYPANDPEKIKDWQALAQKRRDTFQEIITRYTRQMAVTISRKTKGARAITLNTLLEFEAGFRGPKFTEDNGVVDQLMTSLPEIFFELPIDRQSSLLSMHWKRIAGPSMVPVLREILAQPSKPEDQRTELRSLALKRLYELSPQEGRGIILREMKSVPHRVRESVLQILPDAELPEVDEMLADALGKSTPETEFEVIDNYGDLIGRYAGANSLARVKAAASDKIGKMACNPQSSLLAYFLRVDPDYGASALEQALTSRGEGHSGCYRFAFEELGRRFMSPTLEDIAIHHLDDADRTVEIQAIVLLRQKGSPKVEKPLMDLLEHWHAKWQTRAAEVQPQIENGMVAGEPMQFELELVRSLVNGTAWTLDADQLKRIEQLCLTPNGRNEVQMATKALADRTIDISLSSSDVFPINITLGTYHPESIEQLKTKLSTMPKDSRFVWKCFSQDPEAEAKLFQELKTFLAERGMTLDRPEEKKETTP